MGAVAEEATEPEWATQLARELLARHLQTSFPRREGGPPWLGSNATWLPPENPYARDSKGRRRVIAVIGAGASYPVVKLGKELANELELEIGVHNKPEHREVLIRLQRIYGLPPDDFETRLVALCRRPEDERQAREKIAELCDFRHPSLAGYEMIAHLLKHRYLDAVISFNFDELLDQSLDDELGSSEYVRVVSERDCRFVRQPSPDEPDYVPVYVKMHGTASEQESLRFTRESYYWTPKPIIDLVERLLDTENLVVLNVGCRLASFDFQHLLRRPRNVSLFHMSPDPLDDGVPRAINESRGRRRRKVVVVPCSEGSERERFLPLAFEQLMIGLEREAIFATDGLAHWRSVGRHRAVAQMLDTDRVRHHLDEYLLQRTVLEVAFATAKARGVASTTSLVDERCGRYYDLYVAAVARRNDGSRAMSWPAVCTAGGLIESEDSSDAYYADRAVCKKSEPPPRRANPVTNHTLRTIDSKLLAERVLAEIDSTRWAPDARDDELRKLADDLAEVIGDLSTQDELEIHSLDDRICSKVFEAPHVLPTHTAFRAWTRKLLEGDDYDELRVVAETGGWLAHGSAAERLAKLGAGSIKVIVAFDARQRVLRRRLGNRVEMTRMPWWRHNRHMRMVCRDGQPIRALYYARLLRTSMVTPVFLQHPADLKRLESAWDRLLEEAQDHEARLRAGGRGRAESR